MYHKTALCGTPATQCDIYTITIDALPDSIRVFGIEGNGNPAAGCTFDSDMLIDFSVLLNVTWGEFTSEDVEPRDIVINWTTLNEVDNDYFVLQKMEGFQHAWWDLTNVQGAGSSNEEISYSYLDESVNNGINYYRLKQFDFDGNYTLSKTISIVKNYEGYIALKVYPNPANFELFIEGAKDKSAEVVSSDGKIIVPEFQITTNAYILDIQNLTNGMYYLQLNDSEQNTIEKFVVEN